MSPRLIVALLMACIAQDAAALIQPPDPPAVSVWSVAPANPSTRDFIRMRNVFSGCSFGGPSGLTSVDAATRTVTVYLGGSDTCDLVEEEVREARVGYLPAGDYVVRYVFCATDFPPSQCAPANDDTYAFSVAENGRPRMTIPSTSPAGVLALGALLLGAGLIVQHVRRTNFRH